MHWTLSRRARVLAAAAVAGCAALLPAGAGPARAANPACPTASASTAVSCTYASTGAEQTYAVPAGVTSVRITAVGAPGNATATGAGGFGATVSATVHLPPGTSRLYVEVGGTGAVSTDNFNGGAQGGTRGGSGGGASDVRTCSMQTCTAFAPDGQPACQTAAQQDGLPPSACSPDPRLVVAGGGGGGGTDVAGGSAGDASVTGPGDGGVTQGDVPAVPGHDGGFGGSAGGSYNAPSFLGWGGAACRRSELAVVNGKLVGQRIIVCLSAATTTATGSGGGGYYGGGAGLGFAPGYAKDGGGAGSSYWVPDATDTSMATDTTGTPQITITALDLPQSITFTSAPPSGAVVGDSYHVGADATSGLPVTFSVDPTSTTDACAVNGASVSFDHVGTCVIDADQPGDANYAPAPRVQQTITVGRGTPTVTWADPADIPYGTVLGSPQLDATASVPGTFTYTPPAGTLLDVGTHTLTADFTPTDSADYTDASAAASLTVVRAGTELTVTAAPDPAAYGDAVTLTADLRHAAAAPGAQPASGTVTFTVDGHQVGDPVPVAGDTARSIPVTGLGAGSHTIAAAYSGDPRYAGSSDSVALDVQRAAQTVAFTSTPPAGAAYGDTYTVAATATSGLPVQLSIDASSTPGACTLSGSTVTFGGVGSCVIDADQPGDADYAPAPQVRQSFGIGKASPALSWPAPSPIVFGTALGTAQLDATASVAGSFAYSPAAGTVLGVGTHTLTTDFTPTDAADYNTGAASTTITVTPAATALTVTNSPAAPHFGEPVTFAATLGAPAAAVAVAPPSGTVTFSVDGHQLGAPVALAGDTAASAPTATLPAGSHTVTVSYSGDANYLAATTISTLTVARAAQQIAFTSTPPATAHVGDLYRPAATASSGLPVTLSVAVGSAQVCVMHDGAVLFVGAGTCVIEAAQAGDADFAPAAELTQPVRVTEAPGGSSSASTPSGTASTSFVPPSGNAGSSATGSAGGTLSATGAPVAAAVLIGTVLLAGGSILLLLATSRRRRAH
jgi:hypothetical protein